MKMISRRDFLKASAVVGATAAMTACGGSSSTSTAASSVASSTAASAAAATNGSANIGVCIYQFADNFMTLYRADLEGYLKDMGYSVTIMDGKNDQNTQTEQINTFLQQGVDVLVINPVQTTSAQTIVDTVSPSGTPIVFINREPEESVLDSYKGKFCIESFDPFCVLDVKKLRPEICRGQLSMNFCKDPSGLPFYKRVIEGNMLLNFLTGPDFIAYKFEDRKGLSSALCRTLWGIQEVSWTIRQKEDLLEAEQAGSIGIFECFDPDEP